MRRLVALLVAMGLGCAAASAQPVVPAVNFFSDLIPIVPGGIATSQSVYATPSQITQSMGLTCSVASLCTFSGILTVSNTSVALSSAGQLIVNGNTSAPAVVPHPVGALHVVGADGGFAAVYIDSYGPNRPIIDMRQAEGTAAAPIATHNGDELGRVAGRGYTGSAYTNSTAAVSFDATQDFTALNQGTRIALRTTPLNSQGGGTLLVPPEVVTVEPSGGLAVGNATFNATDPGNGVIAALAAFKIGTIYSAAGTPLPTCNGPAEGTWAAVSDATAPTYNAAYSSGGTVHVPVYCDGTSWKTP